jgi:transposase
LHAYLVNERTHSKKVRAELAKKWFQPSMNPFTRRGGREELGKLKSRTIKACLEVIQVLDEHIREIERELKSRAGESEKAKLLMSIDGVGYYSALTVLAEIGDVQRFPNEEKVCSYAGLVPSVHQSGNTRKLGRVTKEGSPSYAGCSSSALGCIFTTRMTRS